MAWWWSDKVADNKQNVYSRQLAIVICVVLFNNHPNHGVGELYAQNSCDDVQ
jgi:hypothetical protein